MGKTMKKRSRIWQPWFLAAVLAVGFCGTWVFVVGFGANMLRSGRWQHKDIVLLPNETLAVVSESNYGGLTYETLDGKPVDIPKDSLSGTFYYRANINPPGPWNPLSWSDLIVSFPDDSIRPNTIWYLVYDGQLDGRAYFVGYDIKSRRLVGYVGKNGFEREMPALDDHFSINGQQGLRGQFIGSEDARAYGYSYRFNACFSGPGPCYVVYLLSGDQLLQINLRDRSVHALRELPGVQNIAGIHSMSQGLPKKSLQREAFGRAMFAAWSGSEILFLDSSGKEIRRWVIPESLRARHFIFYPLNKTTGVANFRQQLHRKPVEQYHFVWFDNQGKIQREESPELPSYESWQRSPWFNALVAPIPALYTTFGILGASNEYLASGESTDWPSALAAALAKLWPPIVVLFLMSVVLAWFCYRRQKRYDQRWTWVWVIFIVLFGVPAMLGYLFHRRWPAIEPCPSCERDAPRDRPACCACGEKFPRPAMKGTEVYA